MKHDANIQWALNFPEQFHWARWEDEDSAVLYHEGSGDTILLSPLGEYILTRINESPLSIPELIGAVCQYFSIEEDDELACSVENSLASFRIMGLIIRSTYEN